MAKKILANFRVKPESDQPEYVTVKVFDTLDNMHKYGRKVGIKNMDYLAVAYSQYKERYDRSKKKWVIKPEFGVIMVTKEHLDFNIIVHETTHIAMRFSELKRFNPRYRDGSKNASRSEERFCYIVGNVATEIASELISRKLIR